MQSPKKTTQKGVKTKLLSGTKARQPKKGSNYSKGIGKNSLVLKKLIPSSTNRLSVGDFCDLKVTALGPKNIGIDEFSYGYSILIPNAQLGETVKAQIIKINLKKAKYAIAKKISQSLAGESPSFTHSSLGVGAPKASPSHFVAGKINIGDILNVKVNKIYSYPTGVFGSQPTPQGINNSNQHPSIASATCLDLSLPLNYPLIIPVNNQIKVGQEIQIKVTKLKLKYGFAKVLSSPLEMAEPWTLDATPKTLIGEIKKGGKITLILPKTASVAAKYLVVRHKSYILFIKNLLGAKLGDKVRVKFTKIGSSFAIGHVIRISPNSARTRLALVRKNLNEMLLNGMHYGEKVVKCQAKMRNFIWNTNKIGLLTNSLQSKAPLPGFARPNTPNYANKNQSFYKGFSNQPLTPNPSRDLPGGASTRQGLLTKNSALLSPNNLSSGTALIKKGRHLINLFKTRRCLNIGLTQLTKYAAKGRTFLFVGTKKPAAGLIARAALFSKTSFFVNTRWLGGMLTNWKTIIKSISKIRPILKEKQKVISNILQKRSKIQNRLIKKVLSLRKKSKVLIKKGKELLAKVKMSNGSGTRVFSYSAKGMISETTRVEIKRRSQELFAKGQLLLEKRQNLLSKQNELKEKTLLIKESGFLLANKYKILLNQLKITHAKFNDLRLLFLLNKELRKIQNLAKEQGKNQFILSYSQFKQLATLAYKSEDQKKFWLIPNPPQEILNKLLLNITEGGASATSPMQSMVSPPAKQGTHEAGPQSVSGRFSIKDKNTTNMLKNDPTGVNGKAMLFNSGKLVILTKLLSKFSRFLPYLKNCITIIFQIIKNIETKITELKTNLKTLKQTLTNYLSLNKKIFDKLNLIKAKYLSEQQIIRILKRKLKHHEAEKKLLQFLPKLRYLPTPKNQISVAIQLLMKRFVDPKMKYSIDLIYDEKLRKKSKKVAAARKKKWQRLETYFGGIANMTKLKKTQISKNVAIIIGQQEEINGVGECRKLGIKMFHIVDTNCNPGLADHFIPANDDSRNSIKYLLSKMVTRIRLAQKLRLRLKK